VSSDFEFPGVALINYNCFTVLDVQIELIPTDVFSANKPLFETAVTALKTPTVKTL
jgi:hypothetical protein